MAFVLRNVEILAAEGSRVSAVELLSLLCKEPDVPGDIRSGAERLQSELAAALPGDAFDAAWHNGKIRDFDAVIGELLDGDPA